MYFKVFGYWIKILVLIGFFKIFLFILKFGVNRETIYKLDSVKYVNFIVDIIRMENVVYVCGYDGFFDV